MQISLTNTEAETIKKLIKNSDWWVHRSIIDKIEYQQHLALHRKMCEHVYGSYIGKKECCSKCGSFFSPGMGSSWTLNQCDHTDRVDAQS